MQGQQVSMLPGGSQINFSLSVIPLSEEAYEISFFFFLLRASKVLEEEDNLGTSDRHPRGPEKRL